MLKHGQKCLYFKKQNNGMRQKDICKRGRKSWKFGLRGILQYLISRLYVGESDGVMISVGRQLSIQLCEKEISK